MSVQLPIIKQFQQEHSRMHEVNSEAQLVALETQDILKNATNDFEQAIKSITNKYEKEISRKDTTLKIVGIALILMTGCAVILATKLILNKC